MSMISITTTTLRTSLLRISQARISSHGNLLRYMSTGTDATPPAPPTTPPLLLKLRSDLKDAMRSKNQAKLDALRNLLSTINNSLKSPTPPTKDSHILAIIHKQLSVSSGSISDFRNAGREDLVTKEQSQIDILAEYAASIDAVTEEEVVKLVEDIVELLEKKGGKVMMGAVMKEVVKVLEEGEKGWVRGDVAAIVKRAMGKRG